MIRLVLALFATAAAALPGAAARPLQPDGSAVAVRSVRIAAASDLKFALDDVRARLRRHDPSIALEAVYGSSGNFYAQLRQRAPFDLYLSADAQYPRDLVAHGIGSERDLFVYALGRLVVWVPGRSRLPVERDHLRALLAARRIAIANPRHAPYGRAAEALLRNAGIWDQVRPRLVLGENVAQAAQFVLSGAADAGLVARSLVVASPMSAAGRYWEVPADRHPPLVQAGLVLPWASSRDAAERVREYLLGEEGGAVLVSFGFERPVRASTGPSTGARPPA